mmetsp:Transcript_25639/g.46305  ORF Transcript_25639/g.46305 Transcript_25639/m.46305 type:complete len:329 (-) Transcript_25639:118-1104(-)|eukprot:CAMPEP_0202493018 /NCGR_PEP_ID=MMETSP1361-20130828/9507_1 /ASSEMBLY_ACC=CAM_ASM_000849 /TAXON_ID=210615 /ORGANISM="Staurosira complex sp., Strain CCMP2646" /LENGTH=328 /DNA_ID=CAMNT_0049123277 /DNA_START=61 /DNA_END=1047 /DNA_ORIENTATION=+
MRSLTLLSLCAAASARNNDASATNAEEGTLSLTPSDMLARSRSLQEGAEGIFRATWGTDHTGSCSLAAVPVATLTCANDAQIALVDETEFSNCAITSMSEMSCVGNLGTIFYSAEFSCAAVEGELPGATAVLGEEEEDCLGDTAVQGTWVHGIQLFLLCDDEPQPIGICEPDESIGERNACSLGYTCAEGGCTAEILTIPDISSTIEAADCSITNSPTSSPAPGDMPTVADSAVPTLSLASSGAPTTLVTTSPAPSESPQPSVTTADTLVPTGAAVPTNDITPTEPSPTAAAGSSPSPTPEPTSGSVVNRTTLASVLAAFAVAIVSYF